MSAIFTWAGVMTLVTPLGACMPPRALNYLQRALLWKSPIALHLRSLGHCCTAPDEAAGKLGVAVHHGEGNNADSYSIGFVKTMNKILESRPGVVMSFRLRGLEALVGA